VEVVTTLSTGTRAWRPRVSILLVVLGWLLFASGARGASPEVVVLPTTGIVDSSMAKYLDDSIGQAASKGAAAVVIKLNTPGGDLLSTNAIVGTLLEAKIPVIVWVAPSGGFAASAGTFITLAANIALMAPGTSIGAASPISGDGTDIGGTLGEKVKNDAIAKITSIANARNRNVDWAVSTVRDARSSPAEEAVKLGAVDGIASTLDEVLAFADGKSVKVAGQSEPVTLHLAGATVTEQGMNPFLALIRLLSDPTIALLLFSTGSAGLIAELWSPNFVTGILGALAILLALIGLGTLPLNVGGLLLIAFGVLLFGLELTVTSHGLLGVGGLICFALGASALFTGPTDPFEPLVRVAAPTIAVIVATAGVFLALIVFGALSSRRIGNGVPLGGLRLGTLGQVRSPLSPIGSVIAAGEEWSARSADGRPLDRGTPIRVIKVEGLTLTVEPEASSSKGT
jgi:membrane-bound serine protease (ClpP class)